MAPRIELPAMLASRLAGVRRCGRGFVAKCVAHEDKTASLSIAVGDDGRILLHCFAGCTALDVVHALGIELADLYPERRDMRDLTPQERVQMRESARQAQWGAALAVLSVEATLVRIAAHDVRTGRTLGDEDWQRLQLACDRIYSAEVTLRAR